MRDEGSITVLRIVGQVDFTLVVRCLSRGGDFMREVALLRPVTDEHGGTLTPMDELTAILAGDISPYLHVVKGHDWQCREAINLTLPDGRLSVLATWGDPTLSGTGSSHGVDSFGNPVSQLRIVVTDVRPLGDEESTSNRLC